jgi:hypothetical protein
MILWTGRQPFSQWLVSVMLQLKSKALLYGAALKQLINSWNHVAVESDFHVLSVVLAVEKVTFSS